MIAVAIRIARQMGLHSEEACAKCSPMDAEMRRRLLVVAHSPRFARGRDGL